MQILAFAQVRGKNQYQTRFKRYENGLRVVLSEAILFLKSMSEEGGSDIERL